MKCRLDPRTRIEALRLSTRAWRALRRAKITTLAELQTAFGPHFLRLRNIGLTTYREIETLLKHFEGSVQVGAAGPAAASLSSEASSATSPLAVSPSQLTSPEFDPATRIEYLPLSTRALNALQRADITTLGQLLAFFGPHFRDLKNVGRRTYCEIKEFVDHLRGDAPLPPQDPLESFRCFLDSLPARDKDILCSRFGLLGRLFTTLHEVGSRYNITRERARQIANSRLRRVRPKLNDGFLSCTGLRGSPYVWP